MSTVRAELKDREWIEVKYELDKKGIISSAQIDFFGCEELELACARLKAELVGKSPSEVRFDQRSNGHGELLASEIVLKVKGAFDCPVKDEELCHCRKVPTVKVDEAVVLGAHDSSIVRRWTSATTGCGSCLHQVEKLIEHRLKKK